MTVKTEGGSVDRDDMARPRKTRPTADQATGTTVRLEVARSASLRLSVRQTTKKDKLTVVTAKLATGEYRRLLLWQYLHKADVGSIQTAVRHLLGRVLPEGLVICRRRVVEAPTTETDQELDDEVEIVATGTLRSVPPTIPDTDPGVELRFGLLEDEHRNLALWALEHSECLKSVQLGPAVRHLLMLSLEGEDLVVGRVKAKAPPAPVATPGYTQDQLIQTRTALGLPPIMGQAA